MGYVEVEPPHKSLMTEYENSFKVKWPIAEPWQVWRKNGIKDYAISTSSNERKSLNAFYCIRDF